jgi:hypothetical protein
MPEEQHGRFGTGPLEVRVADFLARGAIAFARGFSGTLDQAAVGDEILHAGEAVDIMHFIEQHESQDFPHPRDSTQAVEGVSVMLLGGWHDSQLEVGEESVVIGDQRQVDFDSLLDRGIVKALGHASTVGFVGDLFANRGHVAAEKASILRVKVPSCQLPDSGT